MTNKTRDILCSIIVLAFGAAMIYFVKDVRRVIRTDVGSAFVPTLIGWCIVVTGACKLLYSIFTGLKEENKKIVFDQDMFGGIGTIILMVLYMLAVSARRIRCGKRSVFVPSDVTVQREKQQKNYPLCGDCRIASACC